MSRQEFGFWLLVLIAVLCGLAALFWEDDEW